MLNYYVSELKIFSKNGYVESVRICLECDDGAAFYCILTSEGEGALQEMSLSELQDRALRYASDSFQIY